MSRAQTRRGDRQATTSGATSRTVNGGTLAAVAAAALSLACGGSAPRGVAATASPSGVSSARPKSTRTPMDAMQRVDDETAAPGSNTVDSPAPADETAAGTPPAAGASSPRNEGSDAIRYRYGPPRGPHQWKAACSPSAHTDQMARRKHSTYWCSTAPFANCAPTETTTRARTALQCSRSFRLPRVRRLLEGAFASGRRSTSRPSPGTTTRECFSRMSAPRT